MHRVLYFSGFEYVLNVTQGCPASFSLVQNGNATYQYSSSIQQYLGVTR